MKDLAVMYHYVRNRNGWNGIHPLEPQKFEQQIDILSSYYEIVGPDDLDRKGTKPKCVLTFDDATKDQYNIAFEMLKRKGIPAYFTVMSGPLVNGIIPVFSLVHTALSMFSDEEIWDDLNKEFELHDIDRLSSIYYAYEKKLLRRYNKYTLNFFLSEEHSRRYLEKKVIPKYGTEQNFISKFYISKDEFLQMKEAGMTIGVHCMNHKPYYENPLDFYIKEIESCATFIREELGINPKWYTPAFGGGEKYKEMILDLEPILKEKGYKGGFTTIQGLNNGLSNFWLKRYDCVKIPPVRKVSLEELC